MQVSNNDGHKVDSQNISKPTEFPYKQWGVFLAIIYTLYFAQSLIIPLVLTVLVALLLSPLVSLLQNFFIPRAISSIALLAMLATPFTLVGVELVEPAQKWAKLIPKLSLQVTEQVESISSAFDEQAKAQPTKKSSIFDWFSSSRATNVPEKKPATVVTDRIKQNGMELLVDALGAAPLFFAQLLGSVILILFLLIFGPGLFEAFVKEMPTPEQQKKAKRLVTMTQKQLSKYIITVSVINLGLGLTTACTLHFIGLEDALLWGVIVGLLNFIPYAGSVIGLVILSLAGVVQYGVTLAVLFPVGAYLVLNLLESQFITPTVMGKHMLINPLVIMVWLLICGWLWGLVGVLLSVPILVCIKLVLSELKIWSNWLRIIETGR
ncbi:AI-2E family transporter [uncultured Paraglaciecola sp.]|uniref:AI-2E family transporter n=1 Tax=uncultured Paraglaciecola sp. TaxID=1765024 RepID=UPI0025924D56|nr:AI-2E family transporter [uncultured Paraglaciecola sp.]